MISRSLSLLLLLLLLLVSTGPVRAQDAPPSVSVGVCRWYHGKRAAVTMRFDDAHASHLAVAAPLLDEYGLVGTFLVNPGKQRFADAREQWSAIVARGHELGNHTMNHRGARTDEEAEQEIGDCSRVLWEMQPQGSRLRAFQRGGGTVWLQRKPMEYFLAKYDLFQPLPGSLSCSEDYDWFSVDRVRQRLDRARERGDWLQTHYHAVGDGHLRISLQALRQLCQLFSTDDLWSAGMSAVEKYRRERDGACVTAHSEGDDRVVVRLACSTSPQLYDQPLTLEMSLPATFATDAISIRDAAGASIPAAMVETPSGTVLRFDVPPLEADFTLESTGLGQAYRTGRDADFQAPGPHPYVFFTKAELPALRAKTTLPIAATLYGNVQDVADRLLERQPRGADDPVDAQRARRHAQNAATLAFMYTMTGESRYAERAIPEIESALSARSWVHPDHDGDADLVSAEITCGLALCYDWMHDALGTALRERMRLIMVRRGLEPIFKAVEDRVWWSVWSKGNWGAVICGQAGVAAIVLLAEEPRAAEWTRICRRKMWLYTEAVGRDGGWGESVSYCNYCWRNASLFMDALVRLTGGRDNLFDHDRLRKLPDYFAHLMLPDESDFVPFSNCVPGTSPDVYLWRLAREYNNGQAQRVATRRMTRSPVSCALGFIWCDPEVPLAPAVELPTCQHFRTIDWVTLRSRWDDPRATLFAFKGGDNQWDHFHHDHNSFALWSGGRPLLVELGYPHQLWGVRTEAHNTVMVNDHEQLGDARVAGRRGDPRHRTEIGHFVETPWYAHFTGDASPAYDPEEVRSFVREVMYLRNPDDTSPEYFLIFDDVATTAPLRTDWIVHTFGDLSVDENVVTVRQDEAAADITVVAPLPLEQEIFTKSFEQAGVRRPFATAKADTFVKIRPQTASDRTPFLTVIAPRRAGDRSPLTIVPLRGPNLIGARISHGNVVDVALFTLDAPQAEMEEIEFVGRSCFVRRVDGRLTAFAIEQGQSLMIAGQSLLVSQAGGQAVATYLPTVTEMRLNLYDSGEAAIHVPQRPVRCFGNGRALEFNYDVEHRTLHARLRGIERLRIELE